MASRTAATPALSTGSLRKPATPSRNPSGKATPSPAPSPAPTAAATAAAPLADLTTLLNLPLRLTVAKAGDLPQRDVEGSLFTFDSSFVVLSSPASPSSDSSSPSSSSKRTYRLIKTSQIVSVFVLSTTPDPSLPSPTTPLPAGSSASAADLSARVEKAVADDRKARARVGQGVSEDGQALFDAMAKTMPVRWAGKSIVVMDEVMVDEPYGSENVRGAKGAADRVERIKRVLEGIRSRMGTPQPA
ncbi:hypothetical protein JCM11251_004045 [Rhodosporidiobolus azoricus]